MENPTQAESKVTLIMVMKLAIAFAALLVFKHGLSTLCICSIVFAINIVAYFFVDFPIQAIDMLKLSAIYLVSYFFIWGVELLIDFLWTLVATKIDKKMDGYNDRVFQYFSDAIKKVFKWCSFLIQCELCTLFLQIIFFLMLHSGVILLHLYFRLILYLWELEVQIKNFFNKYFSDWFQETIAEKFNLFGIFHLNLLHSSPLICFLGS